MTAEYVRGYYKVPAKRGMRVAVDGRAGVIVSFPGAHLGVRFDLETALELAKREAPRLTVNGRTAAEFLARATTKG